MGCMKFGAIRADNGVITQYLDRTQHVFTIFSVNVNANLVILSKLIQIITKLQ